MEPLQKTLDWAAENLTSTLCACLATHATIQHFYGVSRKKLPEKRWGIFSHRVVDQTHPLVRQINTRFDVPHSRWYDLSQQSLASTGVKTLVESKMGGIHLAVSQDGFRFVYFQGHPEYEINSLLKEYKREVNRYLNHERQDYPPFPTHYFSQKAKDILNAYKKRAILHRQSTASDRDAHVFFDPFPENDVLPFIDNTWNDTGKIVINNWLGLVYQLTNRQRHLPFMVGIDPKNPLAGF